MKTLMPHVAALGAVLLLGASAHASAAHKATHSLQAAHSQTAKAAGARTTDANSGNTDVPAPPMLLLFGMGAVGLIWGRRLSAKANANKI